MDSIELLNLRNTDYDGIYIDNFVNISLLDDCLNKNIYIVTEKIDCIFI